MIHLPKANLSIDPFRYFRKYYKGTLMINGALSPEQVSSGLYLAWRRTTH
jgi:hypothetical protein